MKNKKLYYYGLMGGLLLGSAAFAGVKPGGPLYVKTDNTPLKTKPSDEKDKGELSGNQQVIYRSMSKTDRGWTEVEATFKGKPVVGFVLANNLRKEPVMQLAMARRDGTPINIHALAESSAATRAGFEDVDPNKDNGNVKNASAQLDGALALAGQVTDEQVETYLRGQSGE